MSMKRISFSFLLLCIPVFLFAGEGMWLPHLLKQLNEPEMKSMGMKMSADDIYNVNKGSLKDAIVHFGGFCTGEIISANGLILTNHHCGYGQIQSHSTLQRNYLKNGFWARNRKQELANPGLFVTFINSIEDVTDKVLAGVASLDNEQIRNSQIDKNISELRKSFNKPQFEDVIIRPFFNGNQYFAFHTITYRDVRLVGAPPSSVGKFGADTDNWEWPRHTGDFALFRVYASKDNKPAEYSPDNVPFKPKHFLPISLDGVSEGDFTMVFGFPGRTDQYLPSFAVDQIVNGTNPMKIDIRKQALAVMDQSMRRDPAIQIQYAPKYASVANAYKKWIGENQGINKVNALDKKRKFEAEFQSRVDADRDLRKQYGRVLVDLKEAYAIIQPHAFNRELVSEIVGRNSDLMRFASNAGQWIRIGQQNGTQALLTRWESSKESVESGYKNYDLPTDQGVLFQLLKSYLFYAPSEIVPDGLKGLDTNNDATLMSYVSSIYSQSILSNWDRLNSLMIGNENEIIEKLAQDPAYILYKSMLDQYESHSMEIIRSTQNDINRLMRLYTKAQMEVFATDKQFWPDANSTLRVTYGNVEGYDPRDGVYYHPKSYLSGIMEKYIPGDYEFDLHPKFIAAYQTRDFELYADETGDIPVCFLGSNHTTGGNSGSPAIDAHGNLVGLNFDRVWEGTMSDLNYDPSICRNIMVDMRYILFVIDKIGNANSILSELRIVYPKSKKRLPIYDVPIFEAHSEDIPVDDGLENRQK